MSPSYDVRIRLGTMGIRRACVLLAAWIVGLNDAAALEPFKPGPCIKAALAQAEKSHLTRQRLDDALSRRWLAAFVHRLDPKRMYFLRADLEEFEPFADRLDDQARAESFDFPELVRTRYVARVGEAMKHAAAYVDGEHDFSIDEEAPRRHESFASSAADLQERWRLRIKLERLIEKVYGGKDAEAKSQLAARYRRILAQARALDDERLCEIYLNALLSLYDRSSGYLSPATTASFSTSMVRLYRLPVLFVERDGRLLRMSFPHDGLPLTLLEQGDIELLAIRRNNGEVHDVVEMPADHFRSLVRWATGPLKDDDIVTLELMNSATFQRLAVRCPRTSSR